MPAGEAEMLVAVATEWIGLNSPICKGTCFSFHKSGETGSNCSIRVMRSTSSCHSIGCVRHWKCETGGLPIPVPGERSDRQRLPVFSMPTGRERAVAHKAVGAGVTVPLFALRPAAPCAVLRSAPESPAEADDSRHRRRSRTAPSVAHTIPAQQEEGVSPCLSLRTRVPPAAARW